METKEKDGEIEDWDGFHFYKGGPWSFLGRDCKKIIFGVNWDFIGILIRSMMLLLILTNNSL